MRLTTLKAVLMICLAAAWILPGCQKKRGSPSVPAPPTTGFPQIEASGSASWTGAAKPESFTLRWQATEANFVMIPDLGIVDRPLKGAAKIPIDSPGLTIAAYEIWSDMMLKHVSIKVTHDAGKDSYFLSATSTLLSPKPLLGPPYQVMVRTSTPSEFVPVVFSFFQSRNFLIAEVGYTEGLEGDFVFTTNYQELHSEHNLHRRVRYHMIVP